ncbi:type I methionyl aminopeptidase [Candidatus Dependentiae bacterium]|nr:type I methionyl aminopeptidase [Candidatus Dependentiae bacterium]
MITIKDNQAIEKMATAGRLLGQMLENIKELLVPDISTLELDTWIASYLKQHNLVSSTKGYMGYKHSSCISVNDEVVHGVPQAATKLKQGDLVKIDVCAAFSGYCADMARCFFIGSASVEAQNFVATAYSALDKGIEKAVVGGRLTDISAAIQAEVEYYNYGIVREFAGHGIGKKMHEDPEILNYGKPGCGPVLKAGMAFAIEPMITMGNHRINILRDGWTVKTVDKSLAAHVEDTVIITQQGPRIITRL